MIAYVRARRVVLARGGGRAVRQFLTPRGGSAAGRHLHVDRGGAAEEQRRRQELVQPHHGNQVVIWGQGQTAFPLPPTRSYLCYIIVSQQDFRIRYLVTVLTVNIMTLGKFGIW